MVNRKTRRQFIYAYDLAKIHYQLILTYDEDDIINVGTVEDISIQELSVLIKDVVGYKGEIIFDSKIHDGTMKKRLHVSILNKLMIVKTISIFDGLKYFYQDSITNHKGVLFDKDIFLKASLIRCFLFLITL